MLNCTACGQEVHWVQGISMRTRDIGDTSSLRLMGTCGLIRTMGDYRSKVATD